MTDAPTDDGPAPRTRLSLLAEAALIGAIAILAVGWIIPMQTSEGGIGLSPAFLPTVCATACGVFAVADALLRLVRKDASPRYPHGWTAFCKIAGLALLGMLVLQWLGAWACAVVTVAAGMLVLGERRPFPVVGMALLCGVFAWLMSR